MVVAAITRSEPRNTVELRPYVLCNVVKPKFVQIIHEDAVCTAKKTKRLHNNDKSINAVKQMIALYLQRHTKHINTLLGQNAVLRHVKASGTSTYH